MEWDTNTSILAKLETFSAKTAWGSLVEHFERPMSRFARRSGLAENSIADVVQSALIAFADGYRQGKFDRARGRLSAWLYGILKREIASARRAAALDRAMPLDSQVLDEASSPEVASDEIWQEEWRRAILERGFERVRQEVDASTWECFALQTFHGLSAHEVAARFDWPRTRVYNAKHRIIKRLRELTIELEDA